MNNDKHIGWMSASEEHIESWIHSIKEKSVKSNDDLIAPIAELKFMVENNKMLTELANKMFISAKRHYDKTPLETQSLQSFDEFLIALNHIMTQAPEFTEFFNDKKGALEPCGLIGFPINALLNWPMATEEGYIFFSNTMVNQQFKKILAYWSLYLSSEDSRKVLVDSYPDQNPKVFGWLTDEAKRAMVDVACQASQEDGLKEKPFEYFFKCDPTDEYYGFQSWDGFFTRVFNDNIRPVAMGKNEIANACESAPLQVVKNVSLSDSFWLKGQPYSLTDMMNFDPLAETFVGGTVYQAFLSALSYHRWNSPVKGVVKRIIQVSGSYFLENYYQGFFDGHEADDVAPNSSQPFLTSVATRAIIFIEADDPRIGLMCFIAVGMAEVSSCDVTVQEGQHLEKGDELGMFHFGGSTHCLIFQPQVNLAFDFHNTQPGLDATNIPVGSKIAEIID